MSRFFDFSDSDREKLERKIKETWVDFRTDLTNKRFGYQEIDRAKECTFLKVYDEMFYKNRGFEFNTITVDELKDLTIGRGAILGVEECPDYERFIPKEEFIKAANRFSPPGVEWLYLAIGEEEQINKCSQAECRAERGNRFGFCHFEFGSECGDLKIVDLTIANDLSYDELNKKLETHAQEICEDEIRRAMHTRTISRDKSWQGNFKKTLIMWIVYTYSKLLSEQIFEPLDETDDKNVMYAPFQTMAQYYISCGYSGIIYGSTVCSGGRNLVLFDKGIAHPVGAVEDYIIT